MHMAALLLAFLHNMAIVIDYYRIACHVLHIPALGEQIVSFTKNGIINNSSDPVSAHFRQLSDFFLVPAKAA